MLNKIIFVLVFFCTALLPLYSDGVGTDKTEFIIRNVNYTIEGSTRESVLIHYLNIKSGQSFSSKDKLLTCLDTKVQLINNQRTLAEGRIDASYINDPDNPDITFVDMDVYVKDTWNYILLPYAKYDSNEGFLLSLRGRNYNFLGSMETLSVNLDYLKPDGGTSEYSLNGGLELPFYIWGYNWKFSLDEDIIISSDSPLELQTKAGISMDIPLNSLTWQASVDQEFYLNEDGESDADGYYTITSARLGSSIPTGLDLPLLGELSYTAGLITSYAYKPFDVLSEERKGYELGGQHGISAGQINWQGNFRDGISLSADQNLRYNFTRELWLSNMDIEFQYHKSFGWGGISSRLQGFYLYNSTEEAIGGPIRGILNARLDGNSAIFLNVDFPVKIWIWFLDRWFEGHLSPFFDYAIVKTNDGDFSLNEGWYGAGIEGFAFLKAARSIYLRLSLGVDMEAILDGALPGDPAPRDGEPIYALYLGLGHHY